MSTLFATAITSKANIQWSEPEIIAKEVFRLNTDEIVSHGIPHQSQEQLAIFTIHGSDAFQYSVAASDVIAVDFCHPIIHQPPYLAYPLLCFIRDSPSFFKNMMYNLEFLPEFTTAWDGFIRNSIAQGLMKKLRNEYLFTPDVTDLAKNGLQTFAEKYLAEELKHLIFEKNVLAKNCKPNKFYNNSVPALPKTELNIDAQCLLEITNICSDNEDFSIDLNIPSELIIGVEKGLVKSAIFADMEKRGNRRMTTSTSAMIKVKSSIFQKLASIHSGSRVQMPALEAEENLTVDQYPQRYGYMNYQHICTIISQVLHKDENSFKNLERVCGSKAQADELLKTVLTPNHIFNFLSSSVGSDSAVMQLFKEYQSQDDKSITAKAAEQRLTDICENLLPINNFLRIFFNIISETAHWIERHTENIAFNDAMAMIKLCLGGDKTSMRRFQAVTKVNNSKLTSMLNLMKQGKKMDLKDLFKEKASKTEELPGSNRSTMFEMKDLPEVVESEGVINEQIILEPSDSPRKQSFLEKNEGFEENVETELNDKERIFDNLVRNSSTVIVINPIVSKERSVERSRRKTIKKQSIEKTPFKEKVNEQKSTVEIKSNKQKKDTETSTKEKIKEKNSKGKSKKERKSPQSTTKREQDLSTEFQSNVELNDKFEDSFGLEVGEVDLVNIILDNDSVEEINISDSSTGTHQMISEIDDVKLDTFNFVANDNTEINTLKERKSTEHHRVYEEPSHLSDITDAIKSKIIPLNISTLNNLRALTDEDEPKHTIKQEKENGLLDAPLETTKGPNVNLNESVHKLIADDPDVSLMHPNGSEISKMTLNSAMDMLTGGKNSKSKASQRFPNTNEEYSKHPMTSLLSSTIDPIPESTLLSRHLQTTFEMPTSEEQLTQVSTIHSRSSTHFDNPTPIFGLEKPINLSFTVLMSPFSYSTSSSTTSSYEASVETISHLKCAVIHPLLELQGKSILDKFNDPEILTQLRELHLTKREDLLIFLQEECIDERQNIVIMALNAMIGLNESNWQVIRNTMKNNFKITGTDLSSDVIGALNFLNIFHEVFAEKNELESLQNTRMQVKNIVDNICVTQILMQIQNSYKKIQKMKISQRIIWMSIPENYDQRMYMYTSLGELLLKYKLTVEEETIIVEDLLREILDMLTLLDPISCINEIQQKIVFNRALATIEVLEWFSIPTLEFRKKLTDHSDLMENSLYPFPESFEKPKCLTTMSSRLILTNEYHKLLPEKLQWTVQKRTSSESIVPLFFMIEQNRKIDIIGMPAQTYGNVELKTPKLFQKQLMINNKKMSSMMKKSVEYISDEVLSHRLVTSISTSDLLSRQRLHYDKVDRIDRALCLVNPDIVSQDIHLYKQVRRLVRNNVLPKELQREVITMAIQDLIDVQLILKADTYKEVQKLAFSRTVSTINMLHSLGYRQVPYLEEISLHMDLWEKHMEQLTAKREQINGHPINIHLPANYIERLPSAFLKANNGIIQSRASTPIPVTNQITKSETIYSPFDLVEMVSFNVNSRNEEHSRPIILPKSNIVEEDLQPSEVNTQLVDNKSRSGSVVLLKARNDSKNVVKTMIIPVDSITILRENVKVNVEDLTNESPSFTQSVREDSYFKTLQNVDDDEEDKKVSEKSLSIKKCMNDVEIDSIISNSSAIFDLDDSLESKNILPLIKKDFLKKFPGPNKTVQSYENSRTQLKTEKCNTKEFFLKKRLEAIDKLDEISEKHTNPFTSLKCESESLKLPILRIGHDLETADNTKSAFSFQDHAKTQTLTKTSSKKISTQLYFNTLSKLNLASNKTLPNVQNKKKTNHQNKDRQSHASMAQGLSNVAIAKSIILEETRVASRKSIRQRNEELNEQLRVNLVLRFLRNNMGITDLSIILSDLNTGNPSETTQQMIKQSYEYAKYSKSFLTIGEASALHRSISRPSFVPPFEWTCLGIKRTGRYVTNDTLNLASLSNEGGHCTNERMSKRGFGTYGISVVDSMVRGDIVGYISGAVKERAYIRIKESMIQCLNKM